MKCPISQQECNNIPVKVMSLFSKEVVCCNSCLSDVISKVFANAKLPSSFELLLDQDRMSELTCKHCGSTVDDIRQTRRIGCEHCYDSLEIAIMPFVHLSQCGESSHRGKRPAKFREGDLSSQLVEAIKSENYERASEIKSLMSKQKAD